LLNPRFASWLPLGTRTPPTFEAFEEFARGEELQRNGRTRDALTHYRRATALDTTFTWALMQTAAAYLNLLNTSGADSIAESLDHMRERLTPLELSWLDWMLAVIAENSEEANRAITRAADLAPDRFLYLRAETLRWLNRPAAIVKLLARAGPSSPYRSDGVQYWALTAESYHQLGRHRRELEIAARMRRYQPARLQGLRVEIRALAALGRTSEVLARLDTAVSFPPDAHVSVGSLMRQTAEELRAHGHAEAASKALDRTIAWHLGRPPEEAEKVNHRFELARALYLAGRLEEAESLFRLLAAQDPNNLPEYEGSLGVIAARRNDRVMAETFLSALERQRLSSTPPPKYAMYAQARIVALLGDPARAVRLLREALGGQGLDLHMDADFAPLANDPEFRAFIRPKG
jgi:tetratricopeptide (TPR) repeat protein